MLRWIIPLLTLAFVLGCRHELHMFQQNGYKTKTHLRWLGRNLRYYIPNILLLLLLIFIDFFEILVPPIAAVFAIAITVICLPKKAKKPLVFTWRVRRLCLTLIIVAAVAVSLEYAVPFPGHMPLKEYGAFLALAWLCSLQPFLVFLVNAINAPIERAIGRRYVNEARDILRSMPNLTVVGITGSYGKTSVKHYLTKLLEAQYDVLMTPESYNTTMGVVRTIREHLRPTHQIFVCEMGARNIGDIKEICDLVHPQHGILTSIGEQHLETFKSVANILKTKYELADALPSDGLLFYNGDNAHMHTTPPPHAGVTYGVTSSCDYHAHNISVSQHGTTFTVSMPNDDAQRFETALIGEHNVQNIVGAIACAHALGVNLEHLRGQVRRLESVPHRLQLRPGTSMTIIDDAYNSNPTGAAAALCTLALFDGVKILITPGMVELGGREQELNAQFGAQAASACDHICLVGKTRTAPIRDGAMSAGCADQNIHVFDTFTQAMEWAKALQTSTHKFVLLENDLPDNY